MAISKKYPDQIFWKKKSLFKYPWQNNLDMWLIHWHCFQCLHVASIFALKMQSSIMMIFQKTGFFSTVYLYNSVPKVIFLQAAEFMPNPSASSKIIFIAFKFFIACSIFFKQNQIFWSWSKARFYLIYLHIWAWSKIF